MSREERLRVAHLYCNGKKTLRQCAELLGIDFFEMIDLMRDLKIPLDGGRSPQNDMALKIARQMRDRQTT